MLGLGLGLGSNRRWFFIFIVNINTRPDSTATHIFGGTGGWRVRGPKVHQRAPNVDFIELFWTGSIFSFSLVCRQIEFFCVVLNWLPDDWLGREAEILFEWTVESRVGVSELCEWGELGGMFFNVGALHDARLSKLSINNTEQYGTYLLRSMV